MATREQWQHLLAEFHGLARRYAEVTDWYEVTTPRPGASDGEIRSAEQRLGRQLHPDHRMLLSVCNGWDHLSLFHHIVGTDDIDDGLIWQHSMETLEVFTHDSSGGFAESLGVEDSWDDCVPVIHDDNGYAGHVYMFTEDRRGRRAGNVFSLGDESGVSPDLFTRLASDLVHDRDHVEQTELGEWSEAWGGRDIRQDPPSAAEILDRISELSARVSLPGPRRRTGASPAELDRLEAQISRPLSPEHRALLATTNGVEFPDFRRVLSVAEIADTLAWNHQVAKAVASEQDSIDAITRSMEEHYRTHSTPADQRLPKAPAVATRVGVIPHIPFGFSLYPRPGKHDVYGVDTRDGFVRNLIRDGQVAATGAYEGAPTGVDDFLLRVCATAWHRTQSAP
ncbi:SMI1/KNR4 family protein [Gordonia sp. NPDC127522]|uniref:SMI1/KNR4 family protein n=1 Tax=Gordonia sp. NPDC127522 TaxID=3345390 RepID=UPI003639AF3C